MMPVLHVVITFSFQLTIYGQKYLVLCSWTILTKYVEREQTLVYLLPVTKNGTKQTPSKSDNRDLVNLVLRNIHKETFAARLSAREEIVNKI